MIKQQKERGWEFLFLGANIDAVETAKTYGIERDFAVNFHHDSVGMRASMESVSDAARITRTKPKLDRLWKRKTEADF